MKRVFTIIIAFAMVTFVSAQVTDSGKGFVLDFNVENGSAPELYKDGTFSGVSFGWDVNGDTAIWTIEGGALKWDQSAGWARLSLDFDPPLDLSEDAGVSYKYYNVTSKGEFIMGWNDSDDKFGGEYFPFADAFAVPETQEWLEDNNWVLDPSVAGNGADLAKVAHIEIVLEGIAEQVVFSLDDIVIGDGEIVSSRDIEASQMISVYPNPTYGQVTIQLSSDVSRAAIEVFNCTGQKVYNLKNADTYNELDLCSFAKGMYFIRADADGKSTTSKIILK